MQINIQRSLSIREFQEAFQRHFPFLKIEFYARDHQGGEASPKNNQYDHRKTFGEIHPDLTEGVLSINPGMTVLELEKLFSSQFGLSAQLFRKSGSVWLQTIRTDSWTLKAQNEEAEKTHAKNTGAEPEDYHEQE